jgi:hypothetical protein
MLEIHPKPGKLLNRRATGSRARRSPPRVTPKYGGLLKQPDNQKAARTIAFHDVAAVVL